MFLFTLRHQNRAYFEVKLSNTLRNRFGITNFDTNNIKFIMN